MHYNKGGYLVDTNNNGKKQEIHRIMAEKYLDRKLKPGETVHHIDEDKENNCITNLIVFETCKDHNKYHGLIKTRRLGFPKLSGKDIEVAKNILYQKYGIVFYGPFYKSKIVKNNYSLAERMKRDLGLRESEVLYICP